VTLRTRLLGALAFTAIAFAVLVATSLSVTRDVEERLTGIQREQIPRLELGPRLESDFALLKRSYQDAVAAHDAELLTHTTELRDRLFSDLDRAAPVFDEASVAELRAAVREYCDLALDVSRRMISGRGDEETVAAMTRMQQKQARATEIVERLATIDHAALKSSFDAAYATEHSGAQKQLGVMLASLALVIGLLFWTVRSIVGALSKLERGFASFGAGRLDQAIMLEGADELTAVANEANRMAKRLSTVAAEREASDWVRASLVELGDTLRGELHESEVTARSARLLARRTNAVAAAIYVLDNEADPPLLRLRGQHALSAGDEPGKAPLTLALGEGFVGEALRRAELIVVDDVPPNFLRIESGLGAGAPAHLVFVPFLLDTRASGVIELALFKTLSANAREMLTAAASTIAIALAVARSRSATDRLLARTQQQAARLSEQEEELRSTNEELRCQQEELRQTNDELATQRRRLEQKAGELATVSNYKSQFLANMSHELRTPLNSMLLLSKLLEENPDGNLTAKQTEYARTVHGAGKDLLHLINQVLDLAKVEAGKQTVQLATVAIADIADQIRRVFEPLADEKRLALRIETDANVPRAITTDRQRVVQILTNLIGNAIKFTDRGSVTLRIARAGEMVSFVVRDTGPGIAPEHQARVFQAFEQVDGSAQRKHGGTGLGLGIAREYAMLLGGELRLESTKGEGSTFTCLLPARSAETPEPRHSSSPSLEAVRVPLDLLVIEDDPVFAEVLGDLARTRGLSHAIASDGTRGLELARSRQPRGIILDVKLPDMDGWAVMEKLRADPATAAIPVHMASGVEMAERGLAMGAVGYLVKPADPPALARMIERLGRPSDVRNKVLVVDDKPTLADQLNTIGFATRHAENANEAFKAMDEETFACAIVDLDVKGLDALGFLDRLEARSAPPALVVCTTRPLSGDEAARFDRYAEAVVLKEGASTDRLLDEIRLFVRRLERGGRPRADAASERVTDVKLGDRKILVVDDDMRTVYALSAMLRARGASVLVADTGAVALRVLDENPDVKAVLMDVMMPEMDGYEATRRIRAQARFAALPIVALTAKAMKGDEQRCLEAGATEYLAKPIDNGALLSVLGRLVAAAAPA
jgi:signal transduction histidine kinase/CheY-like chemotaxis protein